ncbi:MAG TPA: vanadium-dependent haloperoxidase [Verrucomicrobiota bacterium]|nr:phosphoesterase PA-phosphatase [Verrucomicrobiales bacterium]HRI14989.1 vanadium-dependent haloperoxidase [Verrucomicrobiota bacterium]
MKLPLTDSRALPESLTGAVSACSTSTCLDTVFRSRRPLGRLVIILTIALVVGSARADVVIDWNVAMADYAAPRSPVPLAPFVETRVYAMAHLAMAKAIRSAIGRPRHSANPEAAGAQAAHDVLVHEFIDGTADFDTLLANELAAIPPGPAKIRGINLGQAAAAEMLAARADDGSANPTGPYFPGSNPGDYQPTPPFDGPPFNGFVDAVNWGNVTPFVLRSGSQFRAPPPYGVGDLEYTFDLNEIKGLGSVHSVERTDDQTQLAIFWYESGGLGWNRIARMLVAEHPRDLYSNARLFGAMNAAMADGYIASIESKFAYNFWRPITAIRHADIDGNDLTEADPSWEPLLLTPPVPDYPSAHATVGAAAATVLIATFGDRQSFTLTSTMSIPFPTVGPRSFERISDAAKENAFSRMLVGIHFRRACLVGYQQGVKVGNQVIRKFKPVGSLAVLDSSSPDSDDADDGGK